MPASGRQIGAGQAAVELGLDDSALVRGLRRASSRVNRFGREVGNIGSQFARIGGLAAGVGLSITGAFASGLRTLADFEGVLLTTQATIGASAQELKTLREEAERLGGSTRFAASEVAQLQLNLARSGFDVSEIVGATEAILSLATATGTTLDAASSTVATTLNQFGLAAAEAARVVDVLAQAAASADVTVASLTESLAQGGPAAAAAGASLEETVALIATLGNSGVRGGAAGTAVRTIFSRLASEADRIQDLFGVNTIDAAGNIRPIIDIIEELRTSLTSISGADAAVSIQRAFGQEALTAVQILTGAQGLRGLREAFDAAEGAADTAAATMATGLNGILANAQSVGEAIRISLGSAVEPLARTLGRRIIELGDNVNTFVRGNNPLLQQLARISGLLVAVGAPLLAIGGALGVAGVAFGLLATPVGAVVAGLTALVVPLAFAIEQFSAGTRITGLFTGSIVSLANELGLLRFIAPGEALRLDLEKATNAANDATKAIADLRSELAKAQTDGSRRSISSSLVDSLSDRVEAERQRLDIIRTQQQRVIDRAGVDSGGASILADIAASRGNDNAATLRQLEQELTEAQRLAELFSNTVANPLSPEQRNSIGAAAANIEITVGDADLRNRVAQAQTLLASLPDAERIDLSARLAILGDQQALTEALTLYEQALDQPDLSLEARLEFEAGRDGLQAAIRAGSDALRSIFSVDLSNGINTRGISTRAAQAEFARLAETAATTDTAVSQTLLATANAGVRVSAALADIQRQGRLDPSQATTLTGLLFEFADIQRALDGVDVASLPAALRTGLEAARADVAVTADSIQRSLATPAKLVIDTTDVADIALQIDGILRGTIGPSSPLAGAIDAIVDNYARAEQQLRATGAAADQLDAALSQLATARQVAISTEVDQRVADFGGASFTNQEDLQAGINNLVADLRSVEQLTLVRLAQIGEIAVGEQQRLNEQTLQLNDDLQSQIVRQVQSAGTFTGFSASQLGVFDNATEISILREQRDLLKQINNKPVAQTGSPVTFE